MKAKTHKLCCEEVKNKPRKESLSLSSHRIATLENE